MKHFHLIILSLLALALCSCRQAEEYYTTRIPIFRVLGPDGTGQADVAIDGKAQSVGFTVLATEEWTVDLDGPEAFSLPVNTGGAGKTAVSLVAASNETGATRKCTLVFKLGGEPKYTFNVSQEEQLPYIEAKPGDVSLSADGDMFTVEIDTNQAEWAYDLGDAKAWITETARTEFSVTFSVPENDTGKRRDADILFYAVGAPELISYVAVSQGVPAAPPTDWILNVKFNDDGSATDLSPLKMKVDNTRLDASCSVAFNEKFGCNVAKFSNESIARSGLQTGYYFIPYKPGDEFANKLADGFSYELVFCAYYDATPKQVKPFSSTQAGGTGMCFRASTGEINFECHVGGGWKELYSGILPVKNQYYHVVGTYDKANGICNLYVDGVLTATVNAVGDFKFMTTNVDAYWFGIGADPGANDTGEASFYGEVVIARLYDNPMSAEEARALYKLVK
jgi:glycerophosphoryl diester phosphodiesterase